MPTIMTHAVAAAVLADVLSPPMLRPRLTAAAAICAMLPDADVVSFALGVPFGSMFAHRGLTHSIPFAAAIAASAALYVGGAKRNPGRSFLVAFLATASHGILDALTNGGSGVAFLAPFSAAQRFFPWSPIEVSPIGFRFFSARGLSVFESELLWVWVPALAILALGRRFRTRNTRNIEVVSRV